MRHLHLFLLLLLLLLAIPLSAQAKGPDADLSHSAPRVLARYIGQYKNDDDNYATCFLRTDGHGEILIDGESFGAAPVYFRITAREQGRLEAALAALPPDSRLDTAPVNLLDAFPQTTVRFKDKAGHYFYTRAEAASAVTRAVSDICNMDPTDPH